MKKHIRQLCMVMGLALVLLSAGLCAGSAQVHAAGDIAKGTFDGVPWKITSGGKLIIGEAGSEFTFSDSETTRDYPWLKDWHSIKSGSFAGTVHGVGDMSGMFDGCVWLEKLDLKNFETSQVTSMSGMFRGGDDPTQTDIVTNRLKKLDLSGFDTGSVTDMSGMFDGCRCLESVDLSSFDTHSVTSMAGMFADCVNLESLDVSGFDTGNVTNMGCMFDYCCGLKNLDVSGFDTARVTNMGDMFDGCGGLERLDVAGFDTSSVTNMSGMFNACAKLKSLDVSSFDTHNVTDMGALFSGCEKLETLDVSGFDTGNVTNMAVMFWGCQRLGNLDVSGFDTRKTGSLHFMFAYCRGLTSLDVSGFDTAGVKDICGMFNSCSNLQSLDLSSFNTCSVVDMNYMLDKCSNLKSLALGPDFACASGAGKAAYEDKFFDDRYLYRYQTLSGEAAEGPSYQDLSAYDGSSPGWYEFRAKTAITKAKVTGVHNKVYTGKKITWNPKVILAGKTLAKGTNYTVSYYGNKNVGPAKVFIYGTGMHTGMKVIPFKILPKGTSLVKVSGGKKALKISWKKQAKKMSSDRITGYKVQFSKDKRFKRGVKTVTVKGYKKTTLTAKKLKAKKKYYVRVRTYMMVDGKMYCSPWSKAKSAKTKR